MILGYRSRAYTVFSNELLLLDLLFVFLALSGRTMFTAALLLLWVVLSCNQCAARSLSVDRVAFRVSYVQDAEKLQRISVAADSFDLRTKQPLLDSVDASLSDTIVAQVVCRDSDGKVAHPTQAVLRIADESAVPPVDTIWPLNRRRNELRREISLEFESRVDRAFWRRNVAYTVQIIVGDRELGESVVWTITREFKLDSAYEEKKRGVFDFDLAIRKSIKPEFDTPIPGARKEAPLSIVSTFSLLSIAPLVCLLIVWGRIGALTITIPRKSKERFDTIMFQLCIAAYIVVLTMFWVEWNIVTTWKVMGLLIIPSLYFGKSSLAFIATQQYLEDKKIS